MWGSVQKKAEIRLKNRALFADSVVMGLMNDPTTHDRLALIWGAVVLSLRIRGLKQ